MREFAVDLQFRDELLIFVLAAVLPYDLSSDESDLLRELRWLHLRLDNLERDQMSGRFTAIVPFCAVADGESSFAQRGTGRIVDTRWFRDYWRGRVGVDGRHGRCRCR